MQRMDIKLLAQGAEPFSRDVARDMANYGHEWEDWECYCGPKGSTRARGMHKHRTHRLRRIESRAVERAAKH